jgi:hypothetical protein
MPSNAAARIDRLRRVKGPIFKGLKSKLLDDDDFKIANFLIEMVE